MVPIGKKPGEFSVKPFELVGIRLFAGTEIQRSLGNIFSVKGALHRRYRIITDTDVCESAVHGR